MATISIKYLLLVAAIVLLLTFGIIIEIPSIRMTNNNITSYQEMNIISASNLTQEYDDCPQFIQTPGCHTDYLWFWLKETGIAANCDWRNCSKCLPPNSPRLSLNILHEMYYIQTYVNGKQLRQQKLLHLLQINNIKKGHKNDPVILIVFNYGFSYLFLNWVCSLDYNNIGFLRKNSLIIVSDNKSFELTTKYGFNMVLNIYDTVSNSSVEINERASKEFGKDAFKPLVALQMIILSDLIEIGYDTMLMDIDIIFNKNPLNEIKNQLYLYSWVDIWTMLDPRYDDRGFANTGLIIMKSNCKTKLFMDTMMKYIIIIILKNDQRAFNLFLNWKPFREIMYKSLDRTLWIPGWDVILAKTTKNDIKRYEDFILFHAFSTGDHFDKIYKFHQIEQWYFNQNKCKHIFNETFLPDVSDRVNQERVYASNKYLLKHNLITDKKHIYNTTIR